MMRSGAEPTPAAGLAATDAIEPRGIAMLRRPTGWLARAWSAHSFRWQILVTFVGIQLAAGLLAATLTVLNARSATEVEIAASMQVAERMVVETVARAAATSEPDQLLQGLPSRIPASRHVRFLVEDAGGGVLALPAAPDDEVEAGQSVPSWFEALVRVDDLRREVPIEVAGARLGKVIVVGEGSDEIAEVWQDMSDLTMLAGIVIAAMFGALYWALGRVLGPLTGLADGLGELEQGYYRHRLAASGARELSMIVERFNLLAGALETAKADNARLGRRLISVQDDERRQIAMELHDEAGPCLFGLRANIGSIAKLAVEVAEPLASRMRDRTEVLLEISERLQTLNRRLLRKLRPMALDHVPLGELITQVVADFSRNAPGCSFNLEIGRLGHRYDEQIELTLYRSVQEGLTNAARHADAGNVWITLAEEADPLADHSDLLVLTVRDDGCGMSPETARGFGIIGIEERVRALGGSIVIDSGHEIGTSIRICLPVERTEPTGGAADGRMRQPR